MHKAEAAMATFKDSASGPRHRDRTSWQCMDRCGDPVGFASEHQNGRAPQFNLMDRRTAHVRAVQLRSSFDQLRKARSKFASLNGNTEQGTHAGLHTFGVEYLDTRRAAQDPVHTEPIGDAQQRAHVPWIGHPVQGEYQFIASQGRDRSCSRLLRDGHQHIAALLGAQLIDLMGREHLHRDLQITEFSDRLSGAEHGNNGKRGAQQLAHKLRSLYQKESIPIPVLLLL